MEKKRPQNIASVLLRFAVKIIRREHNLSIEESGGAEWPAKKGGQEQQWRRESRLGLFAPGMSPDMGTCEKLAATYAAREVTTDPRLSHSDP